MKTIMEAIPRRPSRYDVGCNRQFGLWSGKNRSAIKLGSRTRRKFFNRVTCLAMAGNRLPSTQTSGYWMNDEGKRWDKRPSIGKERRISMENCSLIPAISSTPWWEVKAPSGASRGRFGPVKLPSLVWVRDTQQCRTENTTRNCKASQVSKCSAGFRFGGS